MGVTALFIKRRGHRLVFSKIQSIRQNSGLTLSQPNVKNELAIIAVARLIWVCSLIRPRCNVLQQSYQSLKSGVVALGIKTQDRCQLLIAVTQDLVQKNILASNLIKEAAPLIGGGGGGKQTLAQAGGKHPAGMAMALDKIRELLNK